ncbi:hypothetical protein WDU94_011469 [Cyamophila willieti]
MSEKDRKSEDSSKSQDKESKDRSRDSGSSSSKKPVEDKMANPDREGNCYCGKERNFNLIELFCANCKCWFHESCISYQIGKLVPFMMNYVFICKNCSNTGLESFKKNQAMFPQMCVTAMGNLMQTSIKEGNPRLTFSKEKEIIPFIEAHWDGMTTTPRRVTQSWHMTILRALSKETNVLFTCNESQDQYGLIDTDLSHIKPNYEQMIKGGHIKVTDMGIQSSGSNKGRGAKRKMPGDTGVVSKRGRGGGGEAGVPKLPAHGYPLDHPYNKDGYRYILAEPDPHAPFRQEFDESTETAGKPIPGWLYRTLAPSHVLLALHDRAQQLRISEDRLAVTGDKGYCMVRATNYVGHGTWYWEATVEEMPEGSATRLGWGQEYANLQTPLGYDKFGYSWRSRKGTRFHECRGKHYSEGYSEGDTLGFLIHLPHNSQQSYVPRTFKDKPLVKFKCHLYYEEKDIVNEALKNLTALKKSQIVFFKNGEPQGVAFEDIFAGYYFPCVSLHRNCTVSVNFGPHFKYPLPTKEYPDVRGIWERSEESIVEQSMADVLYLTENDGKLKLDL